MFRTTGGCWRVPLLALTVLVCIAGCDGKDLVAPKNRDPVISSLTASPTAIGPGDSTIVTCNATDADADVLVYDWITDSRLLIQVTDSTKSTLYNTSSNAHVFYHGYVTPYDSAWVQCIVRDGIGGAAGRVVRVLVNQ